MITLSAKHKSHIFHRVWRYQVFFFVFVDIAWAIGSYDFFSFYFFEIALCTLILTLWALSGKRSREVYRVHIDNEHQTVKIDYYQYVYLRFEEVIDFNSIRLAYERKPWGRTRFPKTLQIIKDNKLVVEIKQKYNLGWTNEEIDEIHLLLSKTVMPQS